MVSHTSDHKTQRVAHAVVPPERARIRELPRANPLDIALQLGEEAGQIAAGIGAERPAHGRDVA
jgi:hypothetical protein